MVREDVVSESLSLRARLSLFLLPFLRIGVSSAVLSMSPALKTSSRSETHCSAKVLRSGVGSYDFVRIPFLELQVSLFWFAVSVFGSYRLHSAQSISSLNVLLKMFLRIAIFTLYKCNLFSKYSSASRISSAVKIFSFKVAAVCVESFTVAVSTEPSLLLSSSSAELPRMPLCLISYFGL